MPCLVLNLFRLVHLSRSLLNLPSPQNKCEYPWPPHVRAERINQTRSGGHNQRPRTWHPGEQQREQQQRWSLPWKPAAYLGAASTRPVSTASTARSGTCSTRRQHTRCHRQLSWVSTVSWGTSTPRISPEGTQRLQEPPSAGGGGGAQCPQPHRFTDMGKPRDNISRPRVRPK